MDLPEARDRAERALRQMPRSVAHCEGDAAGHARQRRGVRHARRAGAAITARRRAFFPLSVCPFLLFEQAKVTHAYIVSLSSPTNLYPPQIDLARPPPGA